jgi:hypothetical protein
MRIDAKLRNQLWIGCMDMNCTWLLITFVVWKAENQIKPEVVVTAAGFRMLETEL